MNRLFLHPTKRTFILLSLALINVACGGQTKTNHEKITNNDNQQINLSAAEARKIARDAYIYANPITDNYRILHTYFIDQSNPQFKAPWNTISNVARVYTHQDTAVQTPNSDTPYSFLGLDLRAEPIVLTLPKIDKTRYYSVQLIDLYTHIIGYLGSRTTGNDGGRFLIAGPNWNGPTPKGIDKVLRSETSFALGIYRTQLFNTGDMDRVIQIQNQYRVQTLSSFSGQTQSSPVDKIKFISPLSAEKIRSSASVFQQLNFILQFYPTDPSETELMREFAKLNIGAGKCFDLDTFPPHIQTAIQQGIGDAWGVFDELKAKADQGKVTSADIFGSREFLQNNYSYRKAAAVMGIWGNEAAEAIYPSYFVDKEGNPLDGSNQYRLYFAKGQLPPVHSFWSLTMYKLPESLFVENTLNRYLLNSTMLNDFVFDEDGGLSLYLQNTSPGKDKQANWLPAPAGPFSTVLRLYWPKDSALDGSWQAPQIEKLN